MSIILSDLTARYGKNNVVNHVSLSIESGELFVLLGGSGSGKSTVLRMIAGLMPPASGKIEIDGRDVTHLPPQARETGFVFQNYSVFRHMTVLQNVEFGLRIRRIVPDVRRQRSIDLLDLVGLGGLGERYPDQLSGGQRQRVALARALAYEPTVLLLDEPFSALDVKIRAQLRQSLKEIQNKLKVTSILVTHDQEEAFELADRIGVIEMGFLIEVDTPQALYHHPRTEFAAKFVGGGNVMVGRMEKGQIKLGKVSLPLPATAPAHEEETPVRVLFRPETVIVKKDPLPSQSDIFPLGEAVVREVRFSGSQQRMRIEMKNFEGARQLSPLTPYGTRTFYIEAIQKSDPASMSWQPRLDDQVWVGLQHFHVLDPTGLKILIAYSDTPGGQAALSIGMQMARAANGPTTLLTVADAKNLQEKRRLMESTVQTLGGDPYSRLTSLIRVGTPVVEMLSEAREGDYELVVMGRGRRKLGAIARQILTDTEKPILLVQESRQRIARILICTAGGEPGKADVRFGGRLARHLRAEVCVLHIANANLADWEQQRINAHMDAAQQVLQGLGLAASTKIKQRASGNLSNDILREADDGDYDLIIIGAPAWQQETRLPWTDFASSIVNNTTRPVLIVPMTE